MKIIEIRNAELLSILDDMVTLFRHTYAPERTNNLLGDLKHNSNDWISDEYRDKIIAMGTEHIGYPANARSHALKPDHYNGDNPQYRKDFLEFDERIKTELGISTNALSQLYPPDGFIAWHNNADAKGYNLIFTWSETGDGWFKYIDENGEEVTVKDKKGWSCKAGYFGDYIDGNVCYHAAWTNCWRMTHSFVVSKDKGFWLDCIEHIEGE
jgi:hypothetical protein